MLDRHVAHASGTADNPLSDLQLERKFRLLVEPRLGASGSQRVLETLARLTELEHVTEITDLLVGQRDLVGA